MASDLHWERSGMEEGFVEAEHDRLNLEWHMASVNNVAESLLTDGEATAAGAANRAGANANEEGAEELAQAQAGPKCEKHVGADGRRFPIGNTFERTVFSPKRARGRPVWGG